MPKLDDLLYDIRRIAEHRAVLTDKKLNAIYKELEKDLKHFLADVYEQYADADGRLYVANLDAQRKKAWFLREIAKAVDSIAGPVKEELLKLVDDVYETCYKGMVSSLKSAHKDGKYAETVKDLSVNKEVFKRAIGNNVSKLTLPRVLEKNRSEVIYQIQQELNIGLLNGDRYEQMAKRISERVGVSRSKADNIVRTETHRNTEGGMMDSAEHIQDSLEGSGLIYAATWRTMKDERVRPQQRRKTKKGWKTYRSKTKANHMKMDGKTVAVGELFDLGNGVKTKAPGESGDAANDCRCRCFLEYNLMTAEEFAKATGVPVSKVQELRGLSATIGGDGIPEHEAPLLLKTIDKPDASVIKKELRDFEKDAIMEPIETACVITKNGEVYKCFGTADRVFPDFDLGDKLQGAAVTHNHPIEETEFSFSDDDISLFMNQNLSILRGCDEKYTYELTRNASEIDNVPEDWMDFENYRHARAILIAEQNQIGYRRWKNDKG